MLRFLLFPFAILYDAVTRVRNHLYDKGLKPSIQFSLPVIGVGNLAVGGTGKTPMIEYLVRLLSPSHAIATLSRGYGRKTKGFRLADSGDTAETIGDEPFQLFRKFSQKVTVAVGEERALAIPLIVHEAEVDVILLDDSFQHRRVRPSLQILLTDFSKPFYEDLVLPAGRLRESSAGAARADIIIVTKCPPEISEDSLMQMEMKIREFSSRPVFFTRIGYGNPIPFIHTASACSNSVILLTGIASPLPLVEYVQRNFTLVDHIRFPDHHAYNTDDLKILIEKTNGGEISVVTTEKDMVKIDAPGFENILKRISFFYIPITVQFLKYEAEFDEVIRSHVSAIDKKNTETDLQPE